MNESTPEIAVKSPPRAPRKFQLGIRHLLLGMIFFSAVNAVLFTLPNALASLSVMMYALVLGAVFTAAIVYGSNNVRAFSIGAMFPVALMLIMVGVIFVVISFDASYSNQTDGKALINLLKDASDELEQHSNAMRFVMVTGTVFAPITGACSCFVRWYLQRAK